MNILYNIRFLNRNNGGVYQYSVALLSILGRTTYSGKVFVLCDQPDDDIQEIVKNSPILEFVVLKKIKGGIIPKLIYSILNRFFKILRSPRRVGKGDYLSRIIKEYGIQIIHTPLQDIITRPGVKSITTMHDVQELHFPEFFTSQQRAYRAVHYKKCIDKADMVVVSYNHIKADIIKYFDKPEAKVQMLLLNMSELWFNSLSVNPIDELKPFKLPENFIMYPASTWEHKNHKLLIEALSHEDLDGLCLVLTGHPTEYFYDTLVPLIESYGLSDRVISMGIVSEKQLLALYKTTKAVVIPTLYEAGSFPLMESILLEVPVICSDVTSLPETIGNKEYLFNPYNTEDLVKKIKLIVWDEGFRNKNLANSRKQAKNLLNTGAEEKVIEIYNSLI